MMLAQGRAFRRAAQPQRARVANGRRGNRIVVKALFQSKAPGGDETGAELRKTAKRFGGPSESGNEAIAEFVRLETFVNVCLQRSACWHVFRETVLVLWQSARDLHSRLASGCGKHYSHNPLSRSSSMRCIR